MALVLLQLPDVKGKSLPPIKPSALLGETFQRWGKVRKPGRDNRYRHVSVYRYRCCHCRRTVRRYPPGWIRPTKPSACASWRPSSGCWG